MVDLLKVEYAQTGKSATLNEMGMREMQARAFASRNSQYLLLKAPPASGKSRALMFLGLNKLVNQGLRKVIVAVPEMSIGGSFQNTKLSVYGFFSDWEVLPHNNLCIAGTESNKVAAFQRFMANPTEQILVCTHAALRFAFDKLQPADFNNTLVAIDEFHHVSVDGENRLGNLIDTLMRQSDAHIVAMTGSYFRGDAIPILPPEDEALFTKVTYTYYEQLNGYKYLKSLGIGYHFYQGRYIDALREVLDPHKKTIVHIPNVNSGESTKDKYNETDHILDAIGEVIQQDPNTGIFSVRHPDGTILKVANLVDDNTTIRPLVQNYLRQVRRAEDIDIIIALGMAKEGFDWPWCEHVLTIGFRSSMTEVVQIIGRATRDCEGKAHAQFTNLIAQPDAEDEDVKVSVNNMLKAITLSLLMEQILAPNVTFKPRSRMLPGEKLEPGTIIIDDTINPVSDRVAQILNTGSDELIAALIQKPEVASALISPTVDPEVINHTELPKIIETTYPDLNKDEREQVRQGVLTTMLIRSGGGVVSEPGLPGYADIINATGQTVNRTAGRPDSAEERSDMGTRQFVRLGEKFINIEHINIDLIDQVNPFRGAYEILSKSVTAPMLKTIQEVAAGGSIQMTKEEAVILWPKVIAFHKENDREPSLTSSDQLETRLAQCLAYIKRKKMERLQKQASAMVSPA